MMIFNEYDTVFHLVGEQAVAIYLSAIQFNEKTRHVLIPTSRTRSKAECVANTLGKHGRAASLLELSGNANDFSTIHDQLSSLMGNRHEKCCINITGGTKPMALIAHSISISAPNNDLSSFYLDTDAKKIWFLRKMAPIECYPIKAKMNLDDFIQLAGKESKSNNHITSEPSGAFLAFLYEKRNVLMDFTREMEKLERQLKKTNKIKSSKSLGPEDIEFDAEMEKLAAKMGDDREKWMRFWEQPFCRELSSPENRKAKLYFLFGHWYEYFAYHRLKTFAASQGIDDNDIKMNLNVSNNLDEFDIVYTDGFSLVIVECKTRPIAKNDVSNLEKNLKDYAGVKGRGALVFSLPYKLAIQNNEKDWGRELHASNTRFSVSFFFGSDGLDKLGEKMMSFSSNPLYGEGVPVVNGTN